MVVLMCCWWGCWLIVGGGDHGGRQCGGRQGKISSHVRDSICARRDGSVEGWMTDNVRRRLATSIRRPQHWSSTRSHPLAWRPVSIVRFGVFWNLLSCKYWYLVKCDVLQRWYLVKDLYLLQKVSLLGWFVGGIRVFPSAQNHLQKEEKGTWRIFLIRALWRSVNPISLLREIFASSPVDVDWLKMGCITALVLEVALSPRCVDRTHVVCQNWLDFMFQQLFIFMISTFKVILPPSQINNSP